MKTLPLEGWRCGEWFSGEGSGWSVQLCQMHSPPDHPVFSSFPVTATPVYSLMEHPCALPVFIAAPNFHFALFYFREILRA